MEQLSCEGASTALAPSHDLPGAIESHLRSIRTTLNAYSPVTFSVRQGLIMV